MKNIGYYQPMQSKKASTLSPGNSTDKIDARHIAVEVCVDHARVQAGKGNRLMYVQRKPNIKQTQDSGQKIFQQL